MLVIMLSGLVAWGQDDGGEQVAGPPIFIESTDGGKRVISGDVPVGFDPSTLMDADGHVYVSRTFGASSDEGTAQVVETSVLPMYFRTGVAVTQEAVQARSASASVGVDDTAVVEFDHGPDVTRIDEWALYEVHLRREPVHLPRSSRAMLTTEPLVALESELMRLEAIERRKTDVHDEQSGLRAEAVARGRMPGKASWSANSFLMYLGPQDRDWLAGRPEVSYVIKHRQPAPTGTTADELRVGHQIQPFLDNGYTGESTYASGTWSDVMIAFIDASIDSGHTSFLDCGTCSSRLKERWCWEPDGLGSFELVEGSTDCEAANITTIPSSYVGHTLTTARHHGTWCASQALSDTFDDQYPSQTATWRTRRGGMADEAGFIFIDAFGYKNDVRGGDPSLDAVTGAIEKAIERDVDIISASVGSDPRETSDPCDPAWSTSALAANAAAEAGILVIAAAGNAGTTQTCTVNDPGNAPGALAIGALEISMGSSPDIDPKVAARASYSSVGYDVYGRRLVALLASGGRSNDSLGANGTMADWAGNWSGWDAQGTSFATPLVAGGAADLLSHVISVFGETKARTTGSLQALLLLMTDGMGSSTNAVSINDGAGRLRMRMFNGAGLDSPYGFGLETVLICDGDTWTIPVNPGVSGNTALSVDTDNLRVAGWWYEPNASIAPDPYHDVADIGMTVRTTDLSRSIVASAASPGTRIVRAGSSIGTSSVGNKTWEIRLTGTDVPVAEGWISWDCRYITVAWYFEDNDRDDSDGPSSVIR